MRPSAAVLTITESCFLETERSSRAPAPTNPTRPQAAPVGGPRAQEPSIKTHVQHMLGPTPGGECSGQMPRRARLSPPVSARLAGLVVFDAPTSQSLALTIGPTPGRNRVMGMRPSDSDMIAKSKKPRGTRTLACTRFRRHRVRCFDGAGGASWRSGSSRVSSRLRRCA